MGLNEVVHIIDQSNDIESDYANADLFVIPSQYEGFGLVTAEASSCGLPCVGFHDAVGTNSIIQDGENGILGNTTVTGWRLLRLFFVCL